jgi:hypothetical protein
MDRSGPVEIIPPETGTVPSLTYKYAGGEVLQVVGRHLDPEKHFVPKGWDVKTPLTNFGPVFVGDEGWIQVGRNGYLKSFPEDVVADSPAWPDHGVALGGHQRNWLDCVRSRKRPACDAAIGGRSTTVSHLGCIAHWTGRPLAWDPAAESFVGDEEANRLRSRAMREPWRI